jgi:copper chaperone CopZ
VTDYEVSLEDGEARVSYDPERTDPETIAASVSETGFEAHVEAEAKEPGTSR